MVRICKLAAGAAAIWLAVAGAALAKDPSKIDGKPNLNGIWQAMNTAYWDLEPHSASDAPVSPEKLGAIGAIPAGAGFVDTGTIPYVPAAQAQRDANRKGAPKADPEAACYLPGIPRATYMNHPFQIIEGGKDDILIAYEYANANRVIQMKPVEEPPIDQWMGMSFGAWEGDTLKVVTLGQNGRTWLDRAGNFLSSSAKVTERFTPIDRDHIAYEAQVEDATNFSKPWKISMTLYRNIDPSAQLMDFNCVPFADLVVYGDLLQTKDNK